MVRRVFVLLMLLLLIGIAASISYSQNHVVLTFAVPGHLAHTLRPEDVFKAFYETHPDIRVVFVPYDDGSPLAELVYEHPEQHLKDLQAIAATADILYVEQFEFSVAGTRAKYFLDLKPLIDADTDIDPASYYPPAWNAYQWDGGMWALPLQFSLYPLLYDAEAFATANLNPPSAAWTGDDLITAARAVGDFRFSDNVVLLRALYGLPLQQNGMPDFANEQMVTALTQLATLGKTQNLQPGFDFPIMVGDMGQLYSFPAKKMKQGAVLPGGIVGSRTVGLAISAATNHPEAAYAAARHLAEVSWLFGSIPAYRPLAEQMQPFPLSNTLNGQTVDAQTHTLLLNALETAIPASELNFVFYALGALADSDDTSPDALLEILDTVQNRAIADLALAESMAGTTVSVIPTAVPTPALAQGEIVLRVNLSGGGFDVNNPSSPLFTALDEFVTLDSQVGRVDLIRPSMNNPFPEQDCFVSLVNAATLPLIERYRPTLVIEPLLAADSALNMEDFIPGALAHVSLNGQIRGLPLTIRPLLLRYDAGKFSTAGIELPTEGWQIEAFENALRTFQSSGGIAMEAPNNVDELLLLSIAYGGRPLQYAQTGSEAGRVRYDLTSQDSVNALRDVLDLAREGLMEYYALAANEPHTVTMGFGGPAVYFSEVYFSEADIRTVPYPSGTQLTPVPFDVTAFFISADSLYPDACYRFYHFLLKRYELMRTMPALRPVLQDVTFGSAVGQDELNAYTAFLNQLTAPNAMIVTSRISAASGDGAEYRQSWISQAFDAYVLEDADLETALQEAQTRIDQFNACVAQLEPLEISPLTTPEQYQQHQAAVARCAG